MKRLGQSAITTGAGTLLYTVPNGYRANIRDIQIANTGASELTCLIHFVPTGASATTANTFVPTVIIPAYTMVQWSGTQILNAGDFIQGIGSAAGITVTITGDEDRAST
jgi:hypothetical protein